MPHSVLAVANEMLDRGQARGVGLTPMHLQKLCYMSHGFGLAFARERLIEDQVEAWAYGPVYPELYSALKAFGSGLVTSLIHENNWAYMENVRGEVVRENLARAESTIIEQVFETYARFPAFKLSALTHEEGSPWHQVFEPGRNNPIPDNMIEAYFSELATV